MLFGSSSLSAIRSFICMQETVEFHTTNYCHGIIKRPRRCRFVLISNHPHSAFGAKAADQASHDSDWRLDSQRRPRMGEQLLELPGGLSPPVWPLKYDVQLIGQSEDTKMSSRPKDGIEHRRSISHLTTTTVTPEFATTPAETLPSRSLPDAPRPRVPITMWSAPSFFAVSTIALAGGPVARMTVPPATDTPALFALLTTELT